MNIRRATENRNRVETTYFKGIAILAVIFVHSCQMFDIPTKYVYVQRFSQMGCQLFFVLSAFGLCYSFSEKYTSAVEFWMKRVQKLIVAW